MRLNVSHLVSLKIRRDKTISAAMKSLCDSSLSCMCVLHVHMSRKLYTGHEMKNMKIFFWETQYVAQFFIFSSCPCFRTFIIFIQLPTGCSKPIIRHLGTNVSLFFSYFRKSNLCGKLKNKSTNFPPHIGGGRKTNSIRK